MLKELKKCLKYENKDKVIFDIIIFGSLVKGKEQIRDVDMLVIFLNGSLSERLNKIQKIKINLKKEIKDKNIDIKQILLQELFSPSFFARTGIFLEGISVFKDSKFSETLGFKAFALFWYNLKDLTHTQKVKFNYILAGRKTKGIIEELNGQRLVNGAIKIPMENSIIFEEFLKDNKINYFKKNILEEI